MARMTIEEFEQYISDRITQVAFEKGIGKITEQQAMKELLDLAKWCVDRVGQMSQQDQLRVVKSRVMEAFARP